MILAWASPFKKTWSQKCNSSLIDGIYRRLASDIGPCAYISETIYFFLVFKKGNVSLIGAYMCLYAGEYQSFPIMSDRPDMSGKTEVGPSKYPTTSDLQPGYFLVSLDFWLTIRGL